MTTLFEAPLSSTNSNFCTKKRYRAGQGRNDYTYFAHDLAVGPADKFQFAALLRYANKQTIPCSASRRAGDFVVYGCGEFRYTLVSPCRVLAEVSSVTARQIPLSRQAVSSSSRNKSPLFTICPPRQRTSGWNPSRKGVSASRSLSPKAWKQAAALFSPFRARWARAFPSSASPRYCFVSARSPRREIKSSICPPRKGGL